ncbi:hypothetical protein AB0D01_39655, partial [Streptomyces sp. NPDC048606]
MNRPTTGPGRQPDRPAPHTPPPPGAAAAPGAPHCVIARFEQTALRHPSLPAVEQHAEVTD